MILGGQLVLLKYLAWLQLYFSVCKCASSVLCVADSIVEQPNVLNLEHQSSAWFPGSKDGNQLCKGFIVTCGNLVGNCLQCTQTPTLPIQSQVTSQNIYSELNNTMRSWPCVQAKTIFAND